MAEEKEKVTCPVCGKNFKNQSGLSGHLRFVHPGELGVSKPPPEKPPEEKEAMSLPNQAL